MSYAMEISRQTMNSFVTYGSLVLCCFLTIQTTNAHDYRILTYTDVHGDPGIRKYPPDGGGAAGEPPPGGTASGTSGAISADYDLLTLDIPRQQILIGARNALLRLDLSDLHELEKTEWLASNTTRKICQAKGKDEGSCQNYIRVLLVHKDRVFACGTNAFAPQCSWRQASDLSQVDEWVTGVAKAPYDPLYNNTAIMTADGNLYSATVTDFKGRDPAICRIMGPSAHLRSVQYNNKWLHEPDFISAFEIEDFIYIFFREMALEYDHCGKSVYSRVARICKNDEGGTFLLEDNWTTFKKARLNCSLPGEYPFYFNQIEATYYDEASKKIYAIFTTGPNSIYGSAICSFNMSGLHEAFRGPFTFQEDAKMVWTSVENSILPEHQQCGKHSRKRSMVSQKPQFRNLVDAGNYQMMHHSVQASTPLPLAVTENERWTHIVVDQVDAKHHERFEVLYVATREGILRKLSVLPGSSTLCLLEELHLVSPELHQPITALEMLSSQGVLFVSTKHHIFRIPMQRCHRYTTRELCMKSQDPYCGWDDRSGQCTKRPSTPRPHHHWHQNITSCPILNYTVDGVWSPWGPWETCRHAGGDHGDECRCRARSCDRPPPTNGGADCRGDSMEVANCTVHGNWTSWSEWSACTSTCGTLSIRTRQRKCGNPEPKFGGRVCVGTPREEEYCIVPECPLVTPAPINGGWSSWSSWSRCSAHCDGGIQERHRECNDPVPNANGHHCGGNNFEWRMCNRQNCDEVRKSTEWTSWARVNETREGRIERRYKVVCKANIPQQTDLRVQVKTNERFCSAGSDETCAGTEGFECGWSAWSQWTPCDRVCDGGTSWRERACMGAQSGGVCKDCVGHAREARECNTHSCQGEWSCWGDYSPCSVTCGRGKMMRTRRCETPLPGREFTQTCEGTDREEKPCKMPPCNPYDGWKEWTLWSVCSTDNTQQRRRRCAHAFPAIDQCQGSGLETRMCRYNVPESLPDPALQRTRSMAHGDFQIYHLIITGLLGFLLGGAICVGVFLYCQRFRQSREDEKKYQENPYGTLTKHDMSPNLYMSPSQMSMASTLNNKTYYSTNSLGHGYYKEPGKMTVKEATLKRNSLMRTNLSLNDL